MTCTHITCDWTLSLLLCDCPSVARKLTETAARPPIDSRRPTRVEKTQNLSRSPDPLGIRNSRPRWTSQHLPTSRGPLTPPRDFLRFLGTSEDLSGHLISSTPKKTSSRNSHSEREVAIFSIEAARETERPERPKPDAAVRGLQRPLGKSDLPSSRSSSSGVFVL